MSEDPVIIASGLTKQYAEILAVDHINFKVKKGEIFGFLGPNGAGKTTTIRMLTGLTKPTSGTAKISGRDCVKENLKVKQKIGVVSETSNLYNELSAWDNLTFIGGLYCVDKSTRDKRVEQLLRAFQLYERRNDHLASYSKGMKRRVRIAAALIHAPEVLFLDEPTSGLDVQSSRIIRTLLRELNKEGMTIFLTTHYIDEADQLCGRIAIIRQGRMVVDGSPEQLKSSLQSERIVEVALSGSGSDFETFLKAEPTVKEVTRQGNKYHVHTLNANSVLRKIVEFATSAKLEIISMSTSQPSLEDVFVKYTGLDAVQLERMELLRAVKGGPQRG
ncbi:ATP-binding cassette domain-containing protein [Candidatus Bathyarchaeota archaeon]|nr:ATP-binding cassette domain-containing protein [Candidatus Bathyarchaeota archaeon]